MKGFVKKDRRTDLEKRRDEAVKLLGVLPQGTKEYVDQLDVVERLNNMVNESKKVENKISKDAAITCATSVAGVVICAYRDYLHPIATKGLNFVMKGRVR